MDILLATGNEHKASLIQSMLGRPVQRIDLDLPEIQAIDVKDVIEQKARVAYRLVGKPVLVEDTGLVVHAWNGLPGALIRWFLESVGNEGICRMLAGYDRREAAAEVYLGLYDGEAFVSFSGVVQGHIAEHPRGDNGFGWDPIFVPEGRVKTFAEMTVEDEGDFRTMLKDAVLRFKAYLDH